MRKSLFTIFPALVAAVTMVLAPLQVAKASLLGAEKLTIRDENRLGGQFDRILRSRMSMVGDTYITSYVDYVVQRIVKAKRPMPFRVKSAVIANPILNAFAIPGGYIYIFTGLLQSVDTESQLAGIISHELGHVSQRHVAKRLEKQSKIGLLTMAGVLAGAFIGVAGGSGSGKAAQALIVGSQGLGTAAMLGYSQDDEREADHVGMNALVKAGYNPNGMPQTFKILMKNRWFDSGNSQTPSYLSTHPGLSDRIVYLQDRIARMPPSFSERKDDNTMLRKVQVLVRSKMSDAAAAKAYWENKPKAEYSAMDWIGLGIVELRLKDQDQAKAAFDKALSMDGEDALVCREVGIYYFKIGNYSESFKYLQKALIKHREDALGLFYLARIQGESKDYGRAIANMEKVLKMVPEDSEVHYHLGMLMGSSGDVFGGNLHLAYSSVYSGDNNKAGYYRRLASQAAKTEEQKQALSELDRVIQVHNQRLG
ncbi:M48 family metalloprotease [Pseudodesulfovibrio sp.]|uniref:M48 family metalloprotease n=1 Tax=unclassified Pseudodesulfovibrio TaxID=2661612 RepID=UPI003B00AA46